jgi:lysophospholipase L1-like esterase
MLHPGYVYIGSKHPKHVIQVKLIPSIVIIMLLWGAYPSLVRSTGAAGWPPPPSVTAGNYLALGDSYTIGESVDPADRYPVQAVRLLNGIDHLSCQEPDIIAVTGWTTGNLLDAVLPLKPAAPYRMVSLLIGVNNQYQGRSQAEYRDQFVLLLQKSILLAGNDPSHVLVLSIPDYSVTPFGRTGDTSMIAAQIDSFNRINRCVAADYKVHYIDVTAESRKATLDPSLIAADGLHFSGKEYGRWARLMEPWLKEMLR